MGSERNLIVANSMRDIMITFWLIATFWTYKCFSIKKLFAFIRKDLEQNFDPFVFMKKKVEGFQACASVYV